MKCRSGTPGHTAASAAERAGQRRRSSDDRLEVAASKALSNLVRRPKRLPDIEPTLRDVARPVVDVLTFEGCPHAQPALELVERVAQKLGLEPTVRRIDVLDADSATTHRFLGSPTIRVDGRDIEPGADDRHDYAYSCRIYRTESGTKGEPEERWLHDALLAAA